jgi:hypothetical protein
VDGTGTLRPKFDKDFDTEQNSDRDAFWPLSRSMGFDGERLGRVPVNPPYRRFSHYPRRRTSETRTVMSALGQTQKCRLAMTPARRAAPWPLSDRECQSPR